MKTYINIDSDGYFKGSSIIPNVDLIEVSEEELSKINQFIKPRKVDSVWVESSGMLDIQKTSESILLEITECCKHLTDRALISSISKEGDIDFLKGQAERYRNKYNVAKQYCVDQTINNQAWYDAIVFEMNNTNTELGLVGTENELTVARFMFLIKEAFELGLTRSEKFEPNIEVFRCKTKDLVLSGQFERAKQMLQYAYDSPNELDLSNVDAFMNDIDSI